MLANRRAIIRGESKWSRLAGATTKKAQVTQESGDFREAYVEGHFLELRSWCKNMDAEVD